MDIGVLIIIAVIVFWQSGAFGSARERNKKATLCANLILVSGRNLLQGVLRHPLGYVWAVGAQRVKGGGSRLSCP